MVDEIQALFCGDLFAQPGAGNLPIVESDIFGPSEAMRADGLPRARTHYGTRAPEACGIATPSPCLYARIRVDR
jgi:hypothetical protein